MTFIVIIVVSAALIVGAVWGIYGKLSGSTEGFLVALAGGALMVSAILELIEPASHQAPLMYALASVLMGAFVFCILDYYVKRKFGSGNGGGLLAAITLDGIPENLALGVALIGADPLTVAALSGSIFLSNLPEAAGGAKEMANNGRNKRKILFLWVATAVLLSISAIAGNLLLADVSKEFLAYIRCFAAGAVIASLAIEVFPQAFKEDSYYTGVAAALGVILAIFLTDMGGQ
ncbi:ZIP family metal transporter [Aequorivita echinoideorum]|uniref:Zinc transporter n=1 Tax=Aequorivita echinoideorum TaxID=1549647 RepID=A0ABS5S415_9FLAO|nr:zinc transporter [Aequorivita echinoideorum]MBT0607952.1 zinc transporter [Aequorivita echinoideorum]